MAGLNEMRQRLARAFDLFATHRSRDVKQYANRNGRVVVAEVCNFLLPFVVKDAEGVLSQTGNEAAVDIRHGHRKTDQVSIDDDLCLIVDFGARFLLLRFKYRRVSLWVRVGS